MSDVLFFRFSDKHEAKRAHQLLNVLKWDDKVLDAWDMDFLPLLKGDKVSLKDGPGEDQSVFNRLIGKVLANRFKMVELETESWGIYHDPPNNVPVYGEHDTWIDWLKSYDIKWSFSYRNAVKYGDPEEALEALTRLKELEQLVDQGFAAVEQVTMV